MSFTHVSLVSREVEEFCCGWSHKLHSEQARYFDLISRFINHDSNIPIH
jgi:hypothetical protein